MVAQSIQKNTSPFSIKTALLFILILLYIVVAELSIKVTKHATDTHSSADMVLAQNCFKKYGSIKSFRVIDPDSKEKRQLFLCYDGKDFFSFVNTPFSEPEISNRTLFKVTKPIEKYLDDVYGKWGGIEVREILAPGDWINIK